jgi:hypothetical protein
MRPSASAIRVRATKQPAAKYQPLSNASVRSAGAGVPTMATRRATPSTAPSWRAMELSPVAVAKRPPGTSAIAAAPETGKVMPAPMPRMAIPGSHSDRKAGCDPTRSAM